MAEITEQTLSRTPASLAGGETGILSTRQVHVVLLGILDQVVSVCEANDIDYFLIGGACLGIARHDGGFVPWDDDLDLAVWSGDFPQLLHALASLPAPYKAARIPEMYNAPVKVYDQRTRIHSHGPDDGTAVFIDIMPMMHWRSRRWKRLDNFLTSGRRKLNTVNTSKVRRVSDALRITDPLARLEVKLTNDVFLPAIHRQEIRLMKEGRGIISGAYGRKWHGFFEHDVIYPLARRSFCGTMVNVPRNLERFLELRYGPDYMEIPGEDKRWLHYHTAEWADGYK